MSQTSLSVSKPNSFQWHFRSLFHLFGLSTSHSLLIIIPVSGRKMSSYSFWTTWRNSKRVFENWASRSGVESRTLCGENFRNLSIDLASYVICVRKWRFASESCRTNISLLLQCLSPFLSLWLWEHFLEKLLLYSPGLKAHPFLQMWKKGFANFLSSSVDKTSWKFIPILHD